MSGSGAGLLIGLLAVSLAATTLVRLHIGRVSSLMLQIVASTLPVLFPVQLLMLLLGWIAWETSRGAIESDAGILGVALTVLGAAGLLLYLHRQMRARGIFTKALDESGIVQPSSQAMPYRLMQTLRPLHFKRPGVECLRNLSYGPYGVRSLLDIYRLSSPSPEMAPRPVLLQVHGSGWMVTSKDIHALPMMVHMAEQGWIVVAINYRLSPASKFPAHLIDVKRAIAWIRQNIGEYGGDPDFIAITGGSAGGHLATLAALTFGRTDLQPGFEDADTSVSAAVPIYARYDFLDRDHANELHRGFVRLATRYIMPGAPTEAPELWELASPVSQVREDAPPFLVIHGTHDSVVPVEVARAFVARLRRVSRSAVAYAELPGLQHAYDMVHSPATEFTCQGVHRFIEAEYRQHQERRRTSAGSRPE